MKKTDSDIAEEIYKKTNKTKQNQNRKWGRGNNHRNNTRNLGEQQSGDPGQQQWSSLESNQVDWSKRVEGSQREVTRRAGELRDYPVILRCGKLYREALGVQLKIVTKQSKQK